MKKKLPDTGGKTLQVCGGADAAADRLYNEIKSAPDACIVTGNRYYVSNDGDDANSGNTAEAPFCTLEAIKKLENLLQPGDGVFFERGSVFRIDSDMNLVSDVTYCAYGQGEKPKVYGSLCNYAKPELWEKTERENIWMLSFSSCDPGIIVFDAGSETGKKQAYADEVTVEDDFFYDIPKQSLYLFCSRGNPGTVFGEIEIGTKTRLFHLTEGKRDITVDNIAFAYTSLFGIRADGASANITVTNCDFSWLGGNMFDDATNRFGNAVEFCNGCDGILVEHCNFNQIFDSGVTFQIGGAAFRNFTVRNCLFTYNGMSPFEWWTSGEQGEKDGWPIDVTVMENIHIEHNIMRYTGYGWSRATRAPAHIRNGWNPKHYPNIHDFCIRDNIFDCVNGYIIASGWNDFPAGYTVNGNTYYQGLTERKDEKNRSLVFGYPDEKSSTAGNETEFNNLIATVDQAPNIVVWLGKDITSR